MRIALTELEMTLLSAFKIWEYQNDTITKEDLKGVVDLLLNIIREDTPLYNLILIADSILNDTLIRHITDILLMDEEPNSPGYRMATKLIINHAQDPYHDKALLKALYHQIIGLSHHQTNGSEALIIDAMENIEAIKERLYQS